MNKLLILLGFISILFLVHIAFLFFIILFCIFSLFFIIKNLIFKKNENISKQKQSSNHKKV
jgi:hypothetical protein